MILWTFQHFDRFTYWVSPLAGRLHGSGGGENRRLAPHAARRFARQLAGRGPGHGCVATRWNSRAIRPATWKPDSSPAWAQFVAAWAGARASDREALVQICGCLTHNCEGAVRVYPGPHSMDRAVGGSTCISSVERFRPLVR